MDISRRSYRAELLDQPGIPLDAIERNMKELDVINTYLGGHRITLSGFRKLIGNRKKVWVCEIGCGGGDNLLYLESWCKRHQITLKLTGIDINPHCLFVAQSKLAASGADLIRSDYRLVSFDQGQRPDIIFSSLFCHHFTDDQLVDMLQWMSTYSKTGFFINDLHRHRLAYYSISLLTRAFSRSYLVKHDAPLSVLRGFTRGEWQAILRGARLGTAEIHWKWAFRWLITVDTKQHTA
jgi:2-polyprenyl-3-methyl-5-hydroxy-6-metoxy-1,4-benzoquinol methylase